MQKTQKKLIMYSIGVSLLLLIAYLCRYNTFIHTKDPLKLILLILIRNVIHISLVMAWCVSLNRRIMKKQIRQILVSVGVMMLFWLTVRLCKWEFIGKTDTMIGRYCWYSYYIPMIFIPLLGVFVISYIGKPENYKTPSWMNYLFIPAVLLLLCIFTNDLHQMLFYFPVGKDIDYNVYEYGIIYFITMAWIIFLSIYFVVMLLKKSRTPGNSPLKSMPCFVIAGAIVFWVLYAWMRIKCDVTAIDCIIIVLLIESAIQSGLIPSNSNYKELFTISTVAAQIVDDNYKPRFTSSSSQPISEKLMRSAEIEPVKYDNSILHSKRISGGHVLWCDDISTIVDLQEELQEIQEQLSENNELLKAEVELKKQKIKAEEKSKLYDRIAKEVSPQLSKVREYLKQADNKPEIAQSLISKICVMGAYIKRRGNLLLLGEEGYEISAKELEYCVRESLDNLNLCDIITSLDSDCDGTVPLKNAVAVYDLYEKIVEALLYDMNAMLIRLSCNTGDISLRIQIGCNQKIVEEIISELALSEGIIDYEIQDEDVMIDVFISRGGEV
ncbi:histidine kinase N-terminal 7TM domain-containing protein [Intestinibacter sp.]|uniref:histidine kinase N-terminal 7TM domain-containing protein n=1 Tax=Intestinibacter sp. TaxID=1965304 RepID=UPI003F171A41